MSGCSYYSIWNGIDVPDIHHVIHWGPLSSIKAYVQESGRGGRDGRNLTAVLYYSPADFSGFHPPSASMKEYCYADAQCRWQKNLTIVGDTCAKPASAHSCCDVCAPSCICADCSFLELSKKASSITDTIGSDFSQSRRKFWKPLKKDISFHWLKTSMSQFYLASKLPLA